MVIYSVGAHLLGDFLRFLVIDMKQKEIIFCDRDMAGREGGW